MRQPILYAEQWWKRNRLLALLMILAGVVFTSLTFYQFRRFDQNTAIWLLYVPAGLLMLGALAFYRWRNHVETREDGLFIANLISSLTVGYDLVRLVKVQPLRVHFQDRPKRIAPLHKPLLDKPALFLRLRAEPEVLAYIGRKLGPNLYYDGSIALPVPDPDALAWELNSRLPTRLAANQGGGRRKRRR